MSNENEIRDKLEAVRRRIMLFEWDKSRNQLNSGKLPIFNELKEEKAKLELELKSFSKEEEATIVKNELEG